MLNFNDGLPAIIQPDHATIKSRDRTQHDPSQKRRFTEGEPPFLKRAKRIEGLACQAVTSAFDAMDGIHHAIDFLKGVVKRQ